MHIDDEYYKVIKDYPNYKISNYGNVINITTGKVLNGTKDRNGYIKVCLTNDDGYKSIPVHRLVAEHFIPNPHNYEIVNHIDENKSNPMYYNLEWVTSKDNSNHGVRNDAISLRNGEPICEYSLGGKYIRTWRSCYAVEKIYPVKARSIYGCVIGETKTCYGRQWVLLKDSDNCKDIKSLFKSSYNVQPIAFKIYTGKIKHPDEVPEELLYSDDNDPVEILHDILKYSKLDTYTRNKLIKVLNMIDV